MNQSHLTQAAAPRSEAVARPAGWTASRLAALAIGALLVLVALGLLGIGGTALWAYSTQRDAGYVTTGVHEFSTPASALATERIDLGSAGVGWLYGPGVLGRVRIRVNPADRERALFVGIGPSADVEHYLAGVKHTVVSDFFGDKVENVDGGPPRSAPAKQDFWVAADTGAGARNLTWDPVKGSWSVVVMNADGRPGIDVGADLGARIPAARWIGVGLLAAGVILVAGGALLIAGAIRGRRSGSVATA